MVSAAVAVMLVLAALWVANRYLGAPAQRSFEQQADDPQHAARPPDSEAARTAVHEVGHVVAAWACSLVGKVEGAVSTPIGGLTTYTLLNREDDDARWCELVIVLAGPAAEAMVYQKWRSLPARGDLRKARECAACLAASGSTAPPWRGSPASDLPFGKAFDGAVSRDELAIMRQGYAEARRVVRAHGAGYYRLVAMLIGTGRLTHADIAAHLPKRQMFAILQGGWFMA